mmetsp:Transcript_86475/g.249772  ORF Transcript_86475/g.249772 Transcript_86475/m.249772 type:complete len:366 (-) Transcript_86475:326-1423(-)
MANPSRITIVLALGLAPHAQAANPWFVASGLCEQDQATFCITSPNFQEGQKTDYGSTPCTIQVGQNFLGATVEAFDTELVTDELVTDARSYSGTNKPASKNFDKPGTMTWTSDSSGTGQGFKICADDLMGPMWTVTQGPCTLDKDTGCIATPEYPKDYENDMTCVFNIPAGFGGATVLGFDLDVGDTLVTPDGTQLYGGIKNHIYPPPNSKIRWFPDDDENLGGWKLCPISSNDDEASHLADGAQPSDFGFGFTPFIPNGAGFGGGLAGAMESMPASVAIADQAAWNQPATQAATRLSSIPAAAREQLKKVSVASSPHQVAASLLGGVGVGLLLSAMTVAIRARLPGARSSGEDLLDAPAGAAIS